MIGAECGSVESELAELKTALNLHLSWIWRWLSASFGTLAVGYALYVMWFVATTPDPGLRCLLADHEIRGRGPEARGIIVRSLRSEPIPEEAGGMLPEAGDRLTLLGSRPISSFLDFSSALVDLREFDLPPGGSLSGDSEILVRQRLTEQFRRLPPIVGQIGSGQRYVKAVFQRGQRVFACWLPLDSFPAGEVVLSFTWLVLQLGILLVGGLAWWARPFDRSAGVFFLMCLVTLAGFVGGFHWWVVAGRLWLTIPFAISAMLIPVVTLHFFCLFPEPKPWVHDRPWLAPLGIYALPVFATTALVAGILWINANYLLGRDPQPLRVWLGWLVTGIHWCLGLAATYFGLTLLALVDSLRTARNPLQQRQVTWILWAALLAALPVGYTLYLARFDPEGFALGAATLPMFAASLLLMAAYAVGILRHKLTLIDEVVQRGGWYLALRAGVTVAMLVSELLVCGFGLYQQSKFPLQTPMVLMLVIALLLMLHLVRDRLTRWIDLRMIGERFQLDRAMQPLIQSAGGGQNPEQIARRLLISCRELLGVDRAALYLRETDEGAFPLVAAEQLERAPLRFSSDSELLELLEAETVVGTAADVGSGEVPAGLRILRELDVEIVHALEDSGKLAGALMLGPKRNGTRFNDDDLVLLTSLGQVLQLALRGAQVRQVMTRLNEELRLKTARLGEQQRLIALLQGEITSRATPTATATIPGDDPPFRRDSIRGSSPAMLAVLDTVRKVSGSQSSVLVRGESGTGKELLALALHDNSPRRNGPLVSVNCSALSAGLLESELFGHVQGAFTGAHRDKVGRFEMAHGGTLFLDEIGDISLETQVKLLRVLQEREFEPVGGSQSIKVDVRLIAATHQDLEALIVQGRFREDLFYRLNVIGITLPPLRERGDDVVELAVHFLGRAAERAGKRLSHLDDTAVDALRRYPWPGNIRELENAIERAVVLAERDFVTVTDLPLAVQTGTPLTAGPREVSTLASVSSREAPGRGGTAGRRIRRSGTAGSPPRGAAVASRSNPSLPRSEVGEPTREQLVAALSRAGGNKAEAARLLGVPRSTFFSRLKRHGLD